MNVEGQENDNQVDLYALLNVSRNASVQEIQRAYKKLSRVFHPDKSSDDNYKMSAQRTFVTIKQAHDVLSDHILRLAYDEGDLLAVTLIKRSQSSAHSKTARDEQGAEHDENDDKDDYMELDLYSELQRARSREDAAAILQQVLDEYHLHQKERSFGLQSTFSLEMPYNYGAYSHLLGRELSSMQLSCRKQVSDSCVVTVGANSQVQTTAETDISSSMGVDYQPDRGTNITVDALVPHKKKKAPQLSIRTSRQMANGTFWVVGLAGSLQSIQSWNYSLISYRNILWHDNNDNTTKLQAVWRMTLRPTTGQVQHVMATLKSLQFPNKWSIRLGLGPFPFKINYQRTEKNSPYLSYSWGIMFSRIKFAWLTNLNKWTLKYGIKYDGRGVFMGGPTWSILIHLFSDEWAVRIPIGLFQDASQPVLSLFSILVSQWLDQYLEPWFKRNDYKRSDMNLSKRSAELDGTMPFAEIITQIAAKKRDLEKTRHGLIILQATWCVVTSTVDVTDLLQYWVVEGQLHLPPMQEAKWWSTPSTTTPEEETLTWWDLVIGPKPRPDDSTFGTLTVRYQFAKQVYEICFDGDELVWLPNNRATHLGEAHRVS